MFKLGGKVASQGTGITSGLDTKANYSIGGGVIKGQNMNGREGFKDPDYGGMGIKELIDLQNANQDKQMSGLSDMRDIIKLQAIGNLVGNVLPNIESGGFRAVTDFFKDPMTTQTALSGLTGLKKVDLKEKELQGSKLDKYITQRMGLEQLDIARDKANKELDREIRLRLGNEAQRLLDSVGGDKSQLSPSQLTEYERKMKIAMGSGFLTETELLSQAYQIAAGIYDINDIGENKFNEQVKKIASRLAMGISRENDASGGRVGRAMGSPMMGEQPMQQEMVTEQQDVAMETQGDQGNKVYAMLRARLPQEISDEVVKLIAYNKEAFGDFASIKNQEDVNSFNEKYGVQLVIDMATV
jgi:hypothetical protein